MTGHQTGMRRKRWSFADEVTLRAMKAAGQTHEAIASHFSSETITLSAHAISGKIGHLKRPPLPAKPRTLRAAPGPLAWSRSGWTWTAAENIDLRARVAARESWAAIGAALQRAPSSCRQRNYELRILAGEVAPKLVARAASQKTKRLERDVARAEAKALRGVARDPIKELLGEPPPGRSALDRIKAGLVEPPTFMDGRALRFVPKVTLATMPWRE